MRSFDVPVGRTVRFCGILGIVVFVGSWPTSVAAQSSPASTIAEPSGASDRCPPRAYDRLERDPTADARFHWFSDVENRDGEHCRYEQEIRNRVKNGHDSKPLSFRWDAAGLYAQRSAPLPPRDVRDNNYTIPAGVTFEILYNTPLYYGDKSGKSANTDVYAVSSSSVPTTRIFKLFSGIVGSGRTAEDRLERTTLSATSYTDLAKRDAWLSLTVTGPISAIAFAGLDDPSFLGGSERERYYARLKEDLRRQSLAFALTAGESLGFEADEAGGDRNPARDSFVFIKMPGEKIERFVIPLPSTANPRFVTIFSVLLDAKGQMAGTGFLSAVFPAAERR